MSVNCHDSDQVSRSPYVVAHKAEIYAKRRQGKARQGKGLTVAAWGKSLAITL